MRYRLMAIAVIIALASAIPSSILAGDGTLMQVRVQYSGPAQLKVLESMHPDIMYRGDGYLDIIADQEKLKPIIRQGYKTEIIHEDLTAFYQSRMPNKDMGGYKTLQEIYDQIDLLISTYPWVISSRVSIGLTVEGRDIWAVKVSDNPNVDEDEPEVLFTAGIHAREVVTPEVLLGFLNYLATHYLSDPSLHELINNREVWLIPVINPDGYYYNQVTDPDGGGLWRKNRRDNGDGTFGVDLNRNFGYMWGHDDFGSSPYAEDATYRGTGPFSEPETQAIRDFVQAHNFVFTIHYHSNIGKIFWPWGYTSETTEDEELYSVIVDSLSLLSDYEPMRINQWANNNGSSIDWDYGEQIAKNKILGFGVEVGYQEDGFWPVLSRVPEIVNENIGINLYWCRQAGDLSPLYPLMKPKTPHISAPDTVEDGNFTVSWTQVDTLNPAVSYDLVEIQEIDSVISETCDDFYNWDTNLWEISSSHSVSTPSSFWTGATWDTTWQPVRLLMAKAPYLVQPGDTLRFKTMYYTLTYADILYVMVRDVNDTTWHTLPGNLTTNEDPYGNNWRGNALTGFSGYEFVDAWFNLSAWVGHQIMIQFRYQVISYSPPWGFYIDDISPISVAGIQTEYTDLTESSKTFTDKPASFYHYKVRAKDAQGQYSQYSDEVYTFVMEREVCGDANGDRNVDVADAVYLINYVFKSGAPPDPLCSGDANSDQSTNIADAVYVINYVFTGGPPAVADCCP